MKNTLSIDEPTLLSTLWILVLFNIAFADIVGILTPQFFASLEEMREFLTEANLLIFALLLEIPIIMVLLSRILNKKASRWAHTIAVPITILFVVGGGSLTPHYIFFATAEIILMLYALSLTWRKTPATQTTVARP